MRTNPSNYGLALGVFHYAVLILILYHFCNIHPQTHGAKKSTNIPNAKSRP